MMRAAAFSPLLLAACVEPVPASEVPEPASAPAECRVVAREVVSEPWLAVEGVGASPDAVTLSVMGEWRGVFEDVAGDYQPATAHLYPADADAERVVWASDDGPCGVELHIPMDLSVDVPCLVYGDAATSLVVEASGPMHLELAKLDAPRNLLDRPDFDAALAVRGELFEGVLAVELVWEGRSSRAPAGALSAALQ